MNLYISDLHFGHKNVIRLDGRPFADVEEMDEVMIALWNAKVKPEDHVYILGDVCMRNEKPAEWYLEQLAGHKHLICGNHDGSLLKNDKALACFESVDKMGHLRDGNYTLCMCHYPIADWYRRHRGTWLVYGHIHNRRDDTYAFMKTRERALNAGACLNGYVPCTFDELIENNKIFQEREDNDMQQKKFMDIERIKDSNIGNFYIGDEIVIQEKVDGSNSSIRYDKDTKRLAAFSRKNPLSNQLTLRGFWEYSQSLDPAEYEEEERYVVFGEWLVKHAVAYEKDAYNKWYVYDIYDTDKGEYLLQTEVKAFCEKHHLLYVKTLYTGPFVSWEHCRSFVGQSDIAINQGEGVVIKNQTRLNDNDTNAPSVIKIISQQYDEVREHARDSNKKRKEEDPEQKKEREEALAAVESIVTRRRVEKELDKMIDEGLLPEQLETQHLSIIKSTLLKRVYEDCKKEEPEVVEQHKRYFGKLCGGQALQFAKKIVFEAENKRRKDEA